jgi:hypothetical protein
MTAYTSDEMVDDLNEWSMATAEQRSEAFSILIASVTADAYHTQDADLISRLRSIRAKRNEVAS